MTANSPLVSVIIIFYNAAKYLDEAIQSVFAQSYPHWELLLCDDGSQDGSTAIAQRWAATKAPQVRYLEHDNHHNRGMSATRNLGVRAAKGELIALLDADDVWLPQKLARQVAALLAYPAAGMVYAPSQYWYSWSGRPEDQERDYVPKLGFPPDSLINPPDLLTGCYPLGSINTPCPSNIMLRRTTIDRVGGFEEAFRDSYHLYEDQAFLAKVYLQETVFVIGECLARYRQHRESCSSTVRQNGQYHAVKLFFLSWLAQYLTSRNVNDPRIWHAHERALWSYRHPAIAGILSGIVGVASIATQSARGAAERKMRPELYRRLRQIWQARLRPPVGWVRWGSLRRLTPLSREFGYDRGQPIDRFYIEQFLDRYRGDIRGRVLEIGDDSYTRRFGGTQVTVRDILHVKEGNPQATFVGDLASADHLPSATFDCIILTQTLHLIYDVRAALRTVYRILKPGGVLLATVPGISQIAHDQWGEYWYWSFTTRAIRQLSAEIFPEANVMVGAHGNVLVASAFLYGAAAAELRPQELAHRDSEYELLITLRAVKPETEQ